MPSRFWIAGGAISAAIAVGLGAYHAHGLESMLQARALAPDDLLRQMHSFEVGVRYQMFHSLALILVGLLREKLSPRCSNAAGVLFLAGIMLFSQCLIIPVLAGAKWPWYLVPSGGLAFICGWIVLAIAAMLPKKHA